MHSKVENVPVRLRHAVREDASVWEKLRCQLWPEGAADHGPELASFFAGTLPELVAVLVAEKPDRGMVGFVELAIRTGLAGLEGKRVGYVEGLYALPEVRGCGAVRQILRASRSWACQQKCDAFANDRTDRIIVDRSFSKVRK